MAYSLFKAPSARKVMLGRDLEVTSRKRFYDGNIRIYEPARDGAPYAEFPTGGVLNLI